MAYAGTEHGTPQLRLKPFITVAFGSCIGSSWRVMFCAIKYKVGPRRSRRPLASARLHRLHPPPSLARPAVPRPEAFTLRTLFVTAAGEETVHTHPRWLAAVGRLPGLGHRHRRNRPPAGRPASPAGPPGTPGTPGPGSPPDTRRRSPHGTVAAGVACAAALVTALAGTAQASPAGAAARGRGDTGQTPPACPDGSGRTPLYRDTHYSFAQRAADLVSCMTLAEKVAQLQSNSAPAIPRLGVQQYTYWSEGQHGINTMFADTNHGSVTGGVHATSFPTNFASTMSWDPKLTYDETTAISDEARGFLDKRSEERR